NVDPMRIFGERGKRSRRAPGAPLNAGQVDAEAQSAGIMSTAFRPSRTRSNSLRPSVADELVQRRQAPREAGLRCSSLRRCPASESHSPLRLFSSEIAV